MVLKGPILSYVIYARSLKHLNLFPPSWYPSFHFWEFHFLRRADDDGRGRKLTWIKVLTSNTKQWFKPWEQCQRLTVFKRKTFSFFCQHDTANKSKIHRKTDKTRLSILKCLKHCWSWNMLSKCESVDKFLHQFPSHCLPSFVLHHFIITFIQPQFILQNSWKSFNERQGNMPCWRTATYLF